MSTRHSERAGTALRSLQESDPAMAALALWCDHRDSADGPIADTDGTEIRYGPAYDALPLHEQIGIAAHHVLHVALRHTQRMGAMEARFGAGFDPALYNIAADAIVNEALEQAGYALPRPALLLTGLLRELGQTVTPAEALAAWDADRLYLHLRKTGSGADNISDKATNYAETRDFGQDMQPQRSYAGEDKDQTAAQWRQHLTRALEAGRVAGRGIGTLGHRIADIPAPRTPWEVILRGMLARAVAAQPRQTHARPHRHWIAAEALALQTGGPVPAFQPGTLRRTDVPRIAVGIDTSSSVDDAQMALFMAEIAGIARRSMAEIYLLPFDEEVQEVRLLQTANLQTEFANLSFARGGGTSFVDIVAQAAALRPSALVIMTDLDGPFGPAPRGLPVIWAVPDACAAPEDAPFGIVLDLAQ